MKLFFKFCFNLFIVSTLISCNSTNQNSTKSAFDYVNPFIGTGGHGHTYPGATLPFGMVQLSPDTRLTGWDGCSGYHYSDNLIYGFSHTHLSGTGISDYGDILLMPFNSIRELSIEQIKEQKLIPSTFKKENEKAQPGFYSVYLDNSNTLVELTATERTGIHKYVFENEQNSILIDLNHRDKLLDYKLFINSNNSISGYRKSTAWATNQSVYFYMEFSTSFTIQEIKNTISNDAYSVLNFENNMKEVIVKVGISAVSIEGAKMNLKKEAPHWDFNVYKNSAKDRWIKELDAIKVSDSDEEKLTVFYSALYHTLIVPNIFSDIDGSYRGMDQQIHTDSIATYTVFSLWDTFRAAHPLYTLIQQDKTSQFINTFLKHYKQGGRLPVWELACNETDCMIGYHSISVIADAFLKNIDNFDIHTAYEAMKHSANLNHFGLESYKKYGYIRSADEAESVSKTLEYAYDDWCIAQIAKKLNRMDDYEKFIQRAQFYKNIYDPKTGFMRARVNGGWFTPFDPSEVNFNYTEANSWQYSFFVPQDIQGLVNLKGGEQKFEQKLDSLFSASSETTGREQADITGLIGQYAHGNEPSHHMAYLYNYIGKPWKTQEKVSEIINSQYWNAPDGLSGNEDCGQMSAWYVLSASGFYSVTPGSNEYVIGVPTFDEVSFNLENGHTFNIVTNNKSKRNKYIASATLNGKPYNNSFITHSTIENGGILTIIMGDTPSKTFGVKPENRPTSSITDNLITAVPTINAKRRTFTDSLTITISSSNSMNSLFYSTDDTNFTKYTTPFTIKKSSKISAYAVNNNTIKSTVINAEFFKIDEGRTIKLLSSYANQYAADGTNTLIDMQKGANNFRTGFWQGYQGQDVSVEIDLGKIENITSLSAGFLQDMKSWIWFPSEVSFSISTDRQKFQKLPTIFNTFDPKLEGSYTKEFLINVNKPIRFIKMTAKNQGKCPEWHIGAGGDSWIFIDEISIN